MNRPVLSPPLEEPVVDRVSPAAPRNWGLPTTPKQNGWKIKAAAIVVCLATAAGGYQAYTRLFPKSDVADNESDSDRQSAVVDKSNQPNDGQEIEGTDTEGDPFDESPKAAAIRRNLGSDDDSGDDLAQNTEPRRKPAVSRTDLRERADKTKGTVAVAQKKQNLALPVEIPDDSDEADNLLLEQTDPDASGAVEPPPLRIAPGPTRRLDESGATTDADPAHTASDSRPSRRSSGPMLTRSPSSADDPFDGYTVAEERTAKKLSGQAREKSISVIDATDGDPEDDRFEGFEREEPTTRRATAKTVVTRPDSKARLVAGNGGSGASSGDKGDETLDDSDRADASQIRRKPAPAADARRSFSQPMRSAAAPRDDKYTVVPNDSFWSISKKQYGAVRYYVALSRHNQDRILKPGMQVSTPAPEVLELRYPELIEKPAANPGGQPARSSEKSAADQPNFEKPVSAKGSRPKGESADAAQTGYFYSKAGEPMYRIGADDTLSGIAEKHLGRSKRWSEIYELNRSVLPDPDHLTVGTVIHLPTDASRLSLVPEGDRRR